MTKKKRAPDEVVKREDIARIVEAAKDYNPQIPHPKVWLCGLMDCTYVWEWLAEWIIHMRLEHRDYCLYCKELVGKVDMREHIITTHAERCPICEFSDTFNFNSKVGHLRNFHKNLIGNRIGDYLK